MTDKNLNEYLLSTASKDKWQRIGVKKRAGVLAALFSVYSKNSIGIGELEDIKLLVDWCKKTGKSIIQLLPMNEVGSLFCPYDSISSFALEPMYISLPILPCAQDSAFKRSLKNLKEAFPAGTVRVNYGIKDEKINLLWQVFINQKGCEDREFEKFSADNNYWLFDFALYKALKNHHQGASWFEWQDCYKNRDSKELEIFLNAHDKEVSFNKWLQWLLFKQFKDIKEYAEAKNILIKGDLPILVSRDSADVWAHPEFFKLEFAAGAPPDMYCAKGQRWGMPPYNWEKIAVDGYTYLKAKLKYAENFYDILRIDHVVGLFRIWSIPLTEPEENKGLHGLFDPQNESLWKEHGRNILTVILNNTNMLLCAEDLGVIPRVCTDTLRELGIPGNNVQRWVKDWNGRHDFLHPEEYRAISVAMLSTHDTTNWPAWWENEAGTVDEALFTRKCAQHKIDYNHLKDKLFDAGLSGYSRLRWLNSVESVELLTHILERKKGDVWDFIDMYQNTFQEKEKLWKHLRLSGPMREKCDADIVKAALKITLNSKAIFCIETMIDWLYLTDIFKGDAYQYRINTPGIVDGKNWSLTMPLSLEDLSGHKLCGEIGELIVSAGRI